MGSSSVRQSREYSVEVRRGEIANACQHASPIVECPKLIHTHHSILYAAAHPADSASACSKTVRVAFSCLSGG